MIIYLRYFKPILFVYYANERYLLNNLSIAQNSFKTRFQNQYEKDLNKVENSQQQNELSCYSHIILRHSHVGLYVLFLRLCMLDVAAVTKIIF